MGFSFAGLQKELESAGFRMLYEALRAECPHLASFADYRALIDFFHDRETDYETKDLILHHLIGVYLHSRKYEALAAFFLVLFMPAVARLYTRGRRVCPELGDDDLVQEICLALLHAIRETEIAPHRVAGQIIGKVKNAIQAILRRRIKEGGHARPGSREGPAHRFAIKQNYPYGGEGALYGWVESAGEAIADGFGNEAAADLFDADREVYDLSSVPDVSALLDDLERCKVITRSDRQIIETTVIEGKQLKDLASHPTDYERLKKRRQRALRAIREYLVKSMNPKAK
jgi:hypothetical protein